MATSRTGIVARRLRQLFVGGTLIGLTDAQLLDRFVQRDEASEWAFEALVERHGPMVLSVCRRVLHDRHAAEDAFQATFLVLAQRARSLSGRESIGPWMREVARRAALKARARCEEAKSRAKGRAGRDPDRFGDRTGRRRADFARGNRSTPVQAPRSGGSLLFRRLDARPSRRAARLARRYRSRTIGTRPRTTRDEARPSRRVARRLARRGTLDRQGSRRRAERHFETRRSRPSLETGRSPRKSSS